jgi:putative peptidoglycan lipid II flippase
MTAGYAARSKLAIKVKSFSGSSHAQLMRVTMVVASATVAVRFVAMLKDIATAATFGTNDSADAFLIAMVLPAFLISLAAGSVEAALIPSFVEVKMRDGVEAAHRLLGTITIAAMALLLVLTVALAWTGRMLLPLVGSGFNAEKTALTSNLLLVVLPMILLSGICTIWTSVLNANGQVAIAAFSAVAVPLVSAAALLLASRIDAYALALGVLVGTAIQTGVVGCAMRQSGVPLLPRWGGLTSDARVVFRQYMPMVVASLLLISAPLIDQTMLAGLGSGSVSQFYYGTKIVGVVSGIGIIAVGTAVLPHYSRLVAAKDWPGVRRTLKVYGVAILLAVIPATAILMVGSREIVRILFERGEFTSASADVVSHVQVWSAIQIPFVVFSTLFVRLISSLRANRILMWGTGISFVVNIVGDYVLRSLMGVAGIALATTLVFVISFFFLAFMLRRELIKRERE